MKSVHFALSLSLLFACNAQPTAETPTTTQEAASATQHLAVSLPRSQHTRPLTDALRIRLTSQEIAVNDKVVSRESEALLFVNKNTRQFYTPPILVALAEELEIQKQIVIAEQGKERFDRRVLLYADQDAPALLVWAALFSAIAVGYDAPSIVVEDPSGAPAVLALTAPEKGLLRGVFLDPEGAAPPSMGADLLAPSSTPEARDKESGYGYGRQNSGAEVIEEKASIKGKLDKDVVRRVLRRATPGIKFCYEQALQNNPNLVGRVKVNFVVTESGAISSLSAQGIGVSEEVDGCVARKIGQLSFPAPQGGAAEITYPLIFQTPGNEFDGSNGTGTPSASTQPAPKEPLLLYFNRRAITLSTWPSAVEIAELPPKQGAYDLEALSLLLTQEQERDPSARELIMRWDGEASFGAMLEIMELCLAAKLSAISLPPSSYSL